MLKIIKSFNFAQYAAIGTWLVIFGISLSYLLQTNTAVKDDLAIICIAFIAYLVCFLVLSSEYNLSKLQINTLLALQFFIALAIMWLLPANYLAILTIIWIAIFNHYFSLKITFIALFASLLGFYLIFTIHWQQTNIMMTALLYGTFHVFAILMSHQTRLAEIASEKAAKLNQELQATQYLLAEASKQNERTRIARDLHDLLGHHLTALLINLQVASRITEGEVKASIETCHSIAKLLMSDVREAVSSLRENETIDLKTMINMMAEYIPTLNVQTEIDNELSVENLAVAKCVLSCVQESITNAAKHSDATTLDIHIHQEVNNIIIELTDNGTQARVIQAGNGLTGMQERVRELNGTMAFHCEPNMQIKILLPVT